MSETERERRNRKLREVIEEITTNGGGLRMAENLSREEPYDRDRARAEARAAAAAAEDQNFSDG